MSVCVESQCTTLTRTIHDKNSSQRLLRIAALFDKNDSYNSKQSKLTMHECLDHAKAWIAQTQRMIFSMFCICVLRLRKLRLWWMMLNFTNNLFADENNESTNSLFHIKPRSWKFRECRKWPNECNSWIPFATIGFGCLCVQTFFEWSMSMVQIYNFFLAAQLWVCTASINHYVPQTMSNYIVWLFGQKNWKHEFLRPMYFLLKLKRTDSLVKWAWRKKCWPLKSNCTQSSKTVFSFHLFSNTFLAPFLFLFFSMFDILGNF